MYSNSLDADKNRWRAISACEATDQNIYIIQQHRPQGPMSLPKKFSSGETYGRGDEVDYLN